MNIAIVEIYGHHLYVETLCRCLLAANHTVTVYTQKHIRDEIAPLLGEMERLTFFIPEDGESDYQFLRRHKTEIEASNDLAILATIQGYRILWFFLVRFNLPTIAAAGRISEFFNHIFYRRYLFSLRAILKYVLTGICIPLIAHRLVGLIVHTSRAEALARSRGFKRPIHLMPFALRYQGLGDQPEPSNKSDNDGLQVLITGSLADTSRDYFAVLDVFEKIWQADAKALNLCVLGTPRSEHGQRVYDRMVGLRDQDFPIEFFDKWIPEETYMDRVRRADVIVAPVRASHYSSGELTSVHVEVLRFGKVAIFPSWYRHEKELDEFCYFFEDYDALRGILEELAQAGGIEERRIQRADSYSREMAHLDGCSARLDEFVTALAAKGR